MKIDLFCIFLAALLSLQACSAADCELLPPLASSEGTEMGIIFLPGDGIEGAAYK